MSGTPESIGLHRVRLAGSRHVPGIEFATADVAMRSFPSHLSPGLGVCVKIGDSHRVVADGRTIEYPTDAVCIRSPGCVWESERSRQGFLSVDIPPDLLADDTGEVTAVGGAMVFGPRTADIGVRRIARMLTLAGSRLEVESLAAELVNDLVEVGALTMPAAGRSTHSRRQVVDRAREFLHAHLHLRPSLEETAAAAGTNRFTLVRNFRHELGTTPHAYLVLLRLENAQRLLGAGLEPARVAAETGSPISRISAGGSCVCTAFHRRATRPLRDAQFRSRPRRPRLSHSPDDHLLAG